MSVNEPPPPVRSAKRLTRPPGAEERREHIRYELVAQLQLRIGGEVLIHDIGNISAGGLLISLGADATTSLAVDDVVSVFVDIGDDADGKPISIDAEAVVVRLSKNGGRVIGVGLRWTSQSPHFTERLTRLLGRVNDVAVDA